MRITGELLKSERINQGLTVQNVSMALKLSPKIITAIEAGNSDDLPAKTFVRGFVKSYAEFLKLDPAVVLRQFQEEMGSTVPLPKVPPPKAADASSDIRAARPAVRHTSQNYSHEKGSSAVSIKKQHVEEQKTNNKILISLFVAAVLIVVIIIGNRFVSEPGISVSPDAIAGAQSDSTDVIIPTFDTADPSSLQNQGVSQTGQAETTNASGDATTVSQTTVAAALPTTPPTPMAAPDEDLAPSPGKPIELMFEPKKDIEIFYSKGNQKNFKSIKLVANRLQVLRSPAGLHIKAADGGAFKIIVNGVDIGFAGQNNKPVKLSF